MNTPRDYLTQARELIEEPINWAQEDYAYDAEGFRVEAKAESAVCWCAYGAIHRVCPEGESWATERILERACFETVGDECVALYNDTHTHEEVLALFDKAIELAGE